MAVPLGKTKHYQLAQELCRDIRKMPPGTPLPTIEELKVRFGASQVTIDKAILRLKREGLIRRPDGRKRLVVSEISDKALKRIAIIRPDYPSIVFEEIARAVVKAGRKKDWAFDLVHYRDLEKFDLDHAMEEVDSAVLMVNPQPLSKFLLRELRHPRKPVVVAQDLLADEPEIPAVCSDDRRITELLTQHLISLGHRRIVFIAPVLTSGPMQTALEGWRSSLIAAGVTDFENLLINTQVPPFEYSLRWIYRYLTDWLDHSPPEFTAVVGATTEATIAAMRALREHGRRIPENVSVTGSTGFYEYGPYLDPPLTSVEGNPDAYGQAVIDLLSEKRPSRETAHGATRKILIQPTLQPGMSTAPPARAS